MAQYSLPLHAVRRGANRRDLQQQQKRRHPAPRPTAQRAVVFERADGARRAQTTARRAKKAQPRRHVVPQEHKCVLDSCRKLETEGFDVTYLPVRSAKLLLSLAKHG